MWERLEKFYLRIQEIHSLLMDPQISTDTLKSLNQELSTLMPLGDLYLEWKQLRNNYEGALELYQEYTDELQKLALQEMEESTAKIKVLESRVLEILMDLDDDEPKSLFLEIRAGAGGKEAGLFAGELFRAYLRFCDIKSWKKEILSYSDNELGGIKEAVCQIWGKKAYSLLKNEKGVHRVQRVPETESQGRVHTSTVTVAVLPEVDDVKVEIKDTELRIDTYRASGAGGQHVNRTDSAVRITHLPSGVVVTCQDERSQIKNRARAMKILQSKLFEIAESQRNQSVSEDRKSQVGSGDRSERIRTYNFPQSRITDHRINYTTHQINEFMEGRMDPILDAMMGSHESNLDN